MKHPVIKILAAVMFLSLGAQHAAAACSKATIKENFAGVTSFPETEDYWPSTRMWMVNFNGTGRLTIKKLVEGANGERHSGNGGGTYNLQANCTGVAKVNVKANDIIVGHGRLDYAVGDTKAAPEILGVYTNLDDATSG